MTAVFDEIEVATTGTTAVDVVPNPGASNQSELLLLAVWNRDTATRIVTAQKTGGAITPFELGSVELGTLKRGVIPIAGAVVKNGMKIQVKSDATAATTEPAVSGNWFTIP